ncbi:MAG TPA: hypothetical protein VFD82_01735 [Planctomycetota bacterium]|nr:hypothetical protein [Planctomycetota bacterium]
MKSLFLAGVCLSCLALPSPGKVPAGPWTKSKIPEGWGVHETKNYQIQSQAGMNYLRYGGAPNSAAYYKGDDREMVCYDTGKWSNNPKVEGPVTGPRGSGESKLERRMRRLDEIMTMDTLGGSAPEGWHQYFSWLVVSVG